MANDDGWWARKLSQTQQYPQQQVSMFVQQAPGYPVPQQQAPAPYQQQPTQPQSFAEAIQAVQTGQLPTFGGEATRTERDNCPSCGASNFFSRRNAGGVTTQRGRVAPAPQCYHCGYNGLFEQADASTWAAGAPNS